MKQRGQATTELALGALVFVTVLVFGVHFGEAGYAMLKAKEAAQHAMHRASGDRTHLFSFDNVQSGNTYSPFSPASAGSATQARYANGFKGVFTDVSGVNVSCRRDDTVQFEVQRPALTAEGASALRYLRNIYENRGGVSCEARARMSLFGVSESFAEGAGGFFQEQHARFTTIRVCGAGMPRNGNCNGRLATLTGDWAFEGPMGGRDSEINDDVPDSREGRVHNRPYHHVVRELFDRAGGPYSEATTETPAQRLMRIGGGMNGSEQEWMNETRFSMSYVGERGNGVNVQRHRVFPEYNPNLMYPTVGADLGNSEVRWNKRNGGVYGVPQCFLSVYGCPAYQTNPN